MDAHWERTTAEDYRRKSRELKVQARIAQEEVAARTFRELALQYELLARHSERTDAAID